MTRERRSQADFRNEESDSIGSFNPYEPRPRRRTNVDRYEPNKGAGAAGQSSPGTKRSQKRVTLMKRNNSRVGKKFHAKNVKPGRLTLTSNVNLGIFKKGKTSEPINCPKASYLNFSETKFLSKEAPCPAIPAERIQGSHGTKKSPHGSSSESSDTRIDQELFQSLGNCWQLNVPYEEYVTVASNVQLLSVDDLKELYNKRHYIESEQRNTFEHATRSFGQFRAENSAYDQINALPPTHGPDIPTDTPTNNEEALHDLLLDMVKDFDSDVAMEFLTELCEAAEPSPENCERRPVDDLHAGHTNGLPNHTKERSYLSPCIFGNDHATDSMTGEIRKKLSANIGTIQEHGSDPSSHARDAWHRRDVNGEIITGDYCVDVGRRGIPVYTTMPTSVLPARRYPTTERRFWRCNKLY